MVDDNITFQSKFGFDQEEFTPDKLKFRMDLLKEEFDETMKAYSDLNPEEFVDGHIDLLVIAIGNLYLAGVDVEKAWDEVHRANMSKVRGTKKGREQSGGFDVIKPEGWKAPNHKDNYGKLEQVFAETSRSPQSS